jgi:hypothetical protein
MLHEQSVDPLGAVDVRDPCEIGGDESSVGDAGAHLTKFPHIAVICPPLAGSRPERARIG